MGVLGEAGEFRALVLRFRSRLTLALSLLTAITVAVMSAVLIAVAVASVTVQYNRRGVLLTKLLTRNIEYALELPHEVMDKVGDQMVVSALLTAELVALAEKEGLEPEACSELLRRVIQRSQAPHGEPLVDEFWVTDEQGKTTIATEDSEFCFPDEPDGTQAAEFRALLEAPDKPVKQTLQPRDLDGKAFSYVGVGGVDQPRIVQVGVSEERVRAIQGAFAVQRQLDLFESVDHVFSEDMEGELPDSHIDRAMDPRTVHTEVSHLAVISSEGQVLASMGYPSANGKPVVDKQVLGLCVEFLSDPSEGFSVEPFGEDLGVVTLIEDPSGGPPSALFVQHETQEFISVLQRRVNLIAGTAAVLILLAILSSLLLGRRMSRPLSEIADAAQAFGEGQLARRIDIKADRELQSVATAFNQMADSVQQYMQELHVEAHKRARLEGELRIAAQMQRSLLPAYPPALPGFELAGWSLAAREVGGDFYDFVPMRDGHMAVVIGDGTDKGLPAAMLITECGSVLRALAAQADTPADLLFKTNNALVHRMGDSGRFVTLFCMVVDADSALLRYAMAGHNPPVLMGKDANRAIRLTSKTGLPLGVRRDCRFADCDVLLQPDDTILLYSDGVTEAHQDRADMYGEERLHAQVRQNLHLPLDDMIDAIRSDVHGFSSTPDPQDDMTIVGVRYTQ